jgi:hypothetical protein
MKSLLGSGFQPDRGTRHALKACPTSNVGNDLETVPRIADFMIRLRVKAADIRSWSE